jgi:hypothetical protein
MAAFESRPLALRRLGAGLLTVLLSFAAACGGEEAEAPSPGEARAPAAEPEEAPTALPRSTSSVAVVEQRITLRSNGAARTLLLVELADEMGFELEMGRGLDPEPLVLELRDVELVRALAVLLEGSDYGIFYQFDPARGGHVVARVSVGAEPRFIAAATRREAPESDVRRGEEERRPVERPAAEGQAALEELAERLDTPDAGIRARVVAEIDPDGPGIATLVEVLSDDPDPLVRVAAAEQLGDTDTFLAIRALLDALADPDPQVVVSALDALEFAGDETVIPLLQPLLEHRDAAVRTATAEAIEFLE